MNQLPDIETVAELMHEDWRAKKLAAGVTSRKAAETGEELMVPYAELSDAGKELNRGPARVVYSALEAAEKAKWPKEPVVVQVPSDGVLRVEIMGRDGARGMVYDFFAPGGYLAPVKIAWDWPPKDGGGVPRDCTAAST